MKVIKQTGNTQDMEQGLQTGSYTNNLPKKIDTSVRFDTLQLRLQNHGYTTKRSLSSKDHKQRMKEYV